MHPMITPTAPKLLCGTVVWAALVAAAPALAADAGEPSVRIGGQGSGGPDGPAGPKATASEIGEDGRLPSRAPDRPIGTEWKTLDAVREQLRSLGFRQVGDVDVDDDVYEVDAQTAEGDDVTVQVDPITGMVLRVDED